MNARSTDLSVSQAALEVCWNGVISLYDSESHKGGRNRFDSKAYAVLTISAEDYDSGTNSYRIVTAPCDLDDICYASSTMIENYLNTVAVREALNVPKNVKHYSMMSSAVSNAFTITNDEGISMEAQVRYILENQIDVLIYQVFFPSCYTRAKLMRDFV